MKKILSYTLSILMILSLLMIPSYRVQAANISLSVSASKVNIGDMVKVTVTVPDGTTATVDLTDWSSVLSFSSSSVDVGTNGGTITVNLGKMSMANSNSVTITFKANASGTANIKGTVISAVDNNTVENVTLGGASTSVVVENKTADSGNNNSGTTTPQLSADNSLSSLKLSNATLSPAFKKSTTKYTATVAYDVTKVVVSAKTSNTKAVIESVTDNGTINLKVGQNTIKIVVRAENGTKATYTITVTRKEQESTPVTPPEDTTPPSSEVTPPEVNEMLQWNGEQLYPVETIPTESIPADFESTLLVVNGQQMQGLSYGKADLKVLYLNNTNNAGALYVYDEAQQTIYPYIKLISEKGYVIVLLPDEQNEPAPQGFESCTFSIEGKGSVSAYQLQEEQDFYLLYCMNSAGQKGWYTYDTVEGTYQRYHELTPNVQTGGEVEDDNGNGNTDTSNDDLAWKKQLEEAKMIQYLIFAIAAAVILLLLIIIIILAVKNRKKKENPYEEDNESENYNEIVSVQKAKEVKTVDELMLAEEIDEILAQRDAEMDDKVLEVESRMKELEKESKENTKKTEAKADKIVDVEPSINEVFQKTPVEETSVEEALVEETPVKEVPVKETPVEAVSVKSPSEAEAKEVEAEEPEIKIIRKPKAMNLTSKISTRKEGDDEDFEFIDFQ